MNVREGALRKVPVKVKWFLYDKIEMDFDPIHMKEYLEEHAGVEGQVWVKDITDYATDVKADHVFHLFAEDEDDAIILAEFLINTVPNSRAFVEGVGEIGKQDIHVTCYFYTDEIPVNSLEELKELVQATCKITRFQVRDITMFSHSTSARGVIRFYVSNYDDADLIKEFLESEFGDSVKVYVSEK